MIRLYRLNLPECGDMDGFWSSNADPKFVLFSTGCTVHPRLRLTYFFKLRPIDSLNLTLCAFSALILACQH